MTSNNRIFIVQPVDENRYITGPADGYFSNFDAAEKYITSINYPCKMMAIVETSVHDSWPSYDQIVHNQLTYYKKKNERGKIKMERIN